MTKNDICRIFNSYLSAHKRSHGTGRTDTKADELLRAIKEAVQIFCAEVSPDEWSLNLLLHIGIVPSDEEEMNIMEKNLMLVLDTIKDEYREALILHFMHGKTFEKISEYKECPVSTIKYYVSRGIRNLRHNDRLLILSAGTGAALLSSEAAKKLSAKYKIEEVTQDREGITFENGTRFEIYEKDIDIMGLSKRPTHALKRSGISKVGQLKTLTRKSLMDMRAMGPKSVDQVIEKAEEFGITIH